MAVKKPRPRLPWILGRDERTWWEQRLKLGLNQWAKNPVGAEVGRMLWAVSQVCVCCPVAALTADNQGCEEPMAQQPVQCLSCFHLPNKADGKHQLRSFASSNLFPFLSWCLFDLGEIQKVTNTN